MKIPFTVLSYDDFSESKKLYSYEKDGVHYLPVFTNLNHANIFAKSMQKELSKLGDLRELKCQVCSVKEYAIDMFTTIGLMLVPPPIIIINPARLDINLGQIASEAVHLLEVKKSIADVLEELHEYSDGGSKQ
jgi:hypothetical protein